MNTAAGSIQEEALVGFPVLVLHDGGAPELEPRIDDGFRAACGLHGKALVIASMTRTLGPEVSFLWLVFQILDDDIVG
jgi:hypothetical protein